MKIGEFLVKNNYISYDTLNEALKLQKQNKNLRLGEILVKMKIITVHDLRKYIDEYINATSDFNIMEAKEWLSQEEVDSLFSKYVDKNQKH